MLSPPELLTKRLLIADMLADEPSSTLGQMPKEAIFATLNLVRMNLAVPNQAEALTVFSGVPAMWLDVPVDIVQDAMMGTIEIAANFEDFRTYHRSFLLAHPERNSKIDLRWPAIASNMPEDQAFEGDITLIHSYIAEGHETVPVLQYDTDQWWQAQRDWVTGQRNDASPGECTPD